MASREQIKQEIYERRMDMYALFKSMPNRMVSHTEVARRLGRPKNESFSRDLSVVRRWALDDGNCIGYCRPGGESDEQIYSYMPGGSEKGQSEGGARIRTASVIAQLVNLRDSQLWQEKNAEHPLDQERGKYRARMARNALDSFEGFEEYLEKAEEIQREAQKDPSS